MCILALNIVIDKIYLILWFWFLIIGLFGFIRICCRAVQITSAQVIKTEQGAVEARARGLASLPCRASKHRHK